jgi:DMSO/TMAO reductase YedYZ molybdopterin-dependent catalytic subunit
MGAHLLECAGNTRGARFGLLSIAEWLGVPMADILDQYGLRGRILISGFDEYEQTTRTSVPGASWIFSDHELRSCGAFLATGMNGLPLTSDHGSPLRLVMPGWYGCCCIKWVNSIATVDKRAKPTSQMLEYATRTHQGGTLNVALDFEPALIDLAAMPVRIEKWRIDGRLRYQVIGILWGGSGSDVDIEIQFGQRGRYNAVAVSSSSLGGCRLWTHQWTPDTIGKYEIKLRSSIRAERTRRLDSGYYSRTVDIHEI